MRSFFNSSATRRAAGEPSASPSGCRGVAIIGDAAHSFGPEAGVGSALGLGDALALAQAIVQHSAVPDTSCRSYELCCSPAVRPYEATDPGHQRTMAASTVQARPEERWPPPAEG